MHSERLTLPVDFVLGFLYHGCCMLTNEIAQLEVSNFNKHLPRGGYFHSFSILFGPWYKSVTSLGGGFYAIYTTEGSRPSVVYK